MHGMADWNDYRYFLALARVGTLAGAARELGVEHTTVSRRIAALETTLAVKLFVRTPDGFVLTEPGRAVLGHVETASNAFAAVERVASEDDALRGTVRLTTSEGFSPYVIKALPELRARHPDILVDVLAGNTVFDLTRREADLALRIAITPQPDLIARKLGVLGWGVYASDGYVQSAGMPASTQDLANRDVIAFDESLSKIPGALWITEHGKAARIVMRSNSIVAALNAALAGLGLAVLPCFLAAREPSLRRVPGASIGQRDLSMVVHPDLAQVGRIRAVIDFFAEVIARDAALLAG